MAHPALVAQAVAQVLDARAGAGRTPEQALAERLRGQRLLLVFDNCEHLVAACAQLADHLLRAAPGLSILATSREPLRLAGESSYPVPSLSLPDARQLPPPTELLVASEAVRLFVERATAARPDFALSEANASAVAQICRRLDGIPLALELPAARIRVLSVEQIAERLDDRFRLLAGGSRIAPERQQTLSGAIDWSYDLLSEPERALLRRLSIFVGGWTLEAAEEIGAGTGDVLDLLAQLVAKSLVVSEQQPGQAARFRLLETIREYAHDNLARAGEGRATHNRHLAYFVALAETAAPELRRHGQLAWLNRLDQENDNLLAALNWALEQENAESALRLGGALYEFWVIRTSVVGGTVGGRIAGGWLEAALNLPASHGSLAHSAWRAMALLGLGWLSMIGLYHSNDVSQSVLDESLSLYRELGDKPGMALALTFKGNDRSRRARPNAVPLLDEALDLWTTVDDAWGMGICEYALAETRAHGDPEKARLLQHSAVLLSAVGDRWSQAIALNDLATLTWLEGNGARARALFEETLTALVEMRGAFGTYSALGRLFTILIAQGHFDEARGAALAVSTFGAHPRLKAVSYIRLGQIDYLQGHFAEARNRFEAALELFRELNDRNGISWVPPWLGCVAYRAGDLEQARALIEAGLAVFVGGWSEMAFAFLARADVARAQGNLVQAAELYARGLRLAMERGGKPHAPNYLEGFAKLAVATAQSSRAARLLGAAYALRDEIGTPVPPVERVDYDQALAQAREQLGPAAFEAAWAEGQAMSWEQAAAYALEA